VIVMFHVFLFYFCISGG